MDKRFYVTTPIYYVNAEPHIGHAYSTILADFMARFHNMLGYDTYFLTGTDEHGDKIVKAAEERDKTPTEYSDHISDKFRDAWKHIGIINDDFIRTTEERHKSVVRDILQKVYDNGDIYFGSYGGHYCVGCERFLTEKELVDEKCPEHNAKPQFIEEKNYFFKMSKYQDWLVQYIHDNPDFIRPERYKNEVLALLKGDELEDLCISRPKERLTWGIPLPFDEKYVTYVWFDALINYISAMGYPNDEKFKTYWPVVNHIIAKDIVKPHGVFWPTMLKSAGIEPYHHLNVHGYWNMEDAKMSKSLGNVVSPSDLMEKFGNDQIRYFFMRDMTFGQDAKFSEEAVINRINYDLANDLGNLVNRTLNMANKFSNGQIPAFKSDAPARRNEILEKLKQSKNGYIEFTHKFQTSVGIEKLWEFVRFMNKYVDEMKPWALAKEGKDDELSSTMRNLLEGIYVIAVLAEPMLISKAPEICKVLGAEENSRDLDAITDLKNLTEEVKIGKLGILFPKLEKETKEEKKDTKKKETGTQGLIEFKDFLNVDMRVAQILKATRIEGSDKLLKLEVDSGLDTREIVAGIAEVYEPESLLNKKILLVANLKPAVIFNHTSNGMLLAAKKGKKDKPKVIFVDDAIEVGSKLS